MFRFQKDQKIANIAGVKIGGNPGELPTALAGTIFYEGHDIVENANEGLFDHKIAEELLISQRASSDETGNPCLVHIFGNTEQALRNYIDFVSEITDSPFLIDSPDPLARMAAAEYVSEIGLGDRAVYNSINMTIGEKERKVLKDSDIDSSIVLGFNAMDSGFKGRMQLLESGISSMDKGLIDIALECGMCNILIDPGVTPMGNGSGVCLRITLASKAKWGFPVGSGIHNAPSSWEWLRDKKKHDPLVFKMCDIASAVMQQSAAGNFVLYGPIENAPYIFPVAAMSDIMIYESAEEFEIEPASSHPFNRLV
ncbi:tetrahydromethanopterin S-methyltransferase subunit H [Methanohalophilus halophilus]|uniref:Tetrahydromethanopterin S-methyltransferase subunit H n=1 Tax=Methanohalophilus halophilus TaxID=2177 RepID=A0A1L3Q084_9EURY|nr:tetrahydromethanopterin S-methyltransferase subunit H [Methanohalophilus halophilus]APH38284.1 tetrahydromethanopterin S-methyltransferase subunit H [Methanohalophilus halophilus]RNI10848.1 tetrahydromethanopterin S-methyltransferase subunit H [Methanohalophilus halophilus]SDW01136.1 tetrahydromethanopterin S-methyltransferase, subunit H [Methanohalophilus halophilus]